MSESMEKRIRAIIECDSTGMNKGLQQLNQQLQNNKSALNLASQGIKSFGSDSNKLKNVQKALAQGILLHAQKVDKYRRAMEKTTAKMKDNISTRDKLKQKLNEVNSRYKETVSLYGKESEQAKKAKNEVDKLTDQYKKKDIAVQNNAKSIRNYETNMNKANIELTKAQGRLKSVNEQLEKSNNKWDGASNKLKAHSEKLRNIGTGISGVGTKLLGLTAPLIAVGGGALKVSSDFETSMSNVQAISGATGEDFKRLGDKAKELGAKTSKSAKESADAMSYQALAGWNVNQILEATEPILRLSEASNMDLARASDLVTDSMSAMGIQTKDLTQYLDVCSQAQRKSNTTAEMMLEAYVSCGGTLKNLKVPLTESATWIGVLANRGIKGSEAGTSLNSVLINLTSGAGQAGTAMQELGLSAFDSHGKFKGVKKVLTELNKKLAKCTEKQRNTYLAMIGGKTQIDTLNAMLSGCSEEFNSLNGEIKNSKGAMTEMAETMQKNLHGDIVKLKSQLEGVGIQLGQVLIPVAKDFVATLSKWVDWFSKLDPATQKSIIKMTALGVAGGGALKILGGGINTIASVCGGLSKLTKFLGITKVATTAVGTASTVASGVAGAGGVAGLTASLGSAVIAFAPFIAGAGALALAGYEINKSMKEEVIPAIDLFADRVETTAHNIKSNNGTIITSYTQSTIKISEETKKQVGAYMELDKKASQSLMNLNTNSKLFTTEAKTSVIKNFTEMVAKGSKKSKEFNTNIVKEFTKLVQNTGTLTEENKKDIVSKYTSMVLDCDKLTTTQKNNTVKTFKKILKETTGITDKQVTNLVNKYTEMAKNIENGEEKHYKERVTMLNNFFKSNSSISTKEQKDILSREENFYNYRKSNAEDCKNKIIDIITKAKNEHRQLKSEEVKEISKLQEEMKQHAIQSLSKTEIECKVIQERIKDFGKRITAEQASECIKNAEKQRQGTVDKANRQYIETVDKIKEMRDKTHSITKEQADKMIKEAERQKNDVKKKAEEQKKAVVEQIQQQNSDVLKDINTTDGEIMSGWDKLRNWFTDNPLVRWIKTKTSGGDADNNWTGNNYFRGGLTYLHERGEELYDLPRGTKIYNHKLSEKMVMETAEAMAEKVFNKMTNGMSNNGVNVVQNIYSPTPSPSEIARQTKNNLQNLALQW